MYTAVQDRNAGRGAATLRWLRLALVACGLLALAIGSKWAASHCCVQVAPEHAHLLDCIVAAALIAYVVAMALPFVPGIEIGLALMLVLGEEGVAAVYAATQLALLLSYLLGRWVPTHRVGAAFRWLGMERAAQLVETIDSIPPAGRAAHLARLAPARWLAALGRHPGLLLATALNIPGNALVGGAGGIGMIAGLSGAFPLARYLPLVAAATAPVPLLLLLRGAA